MNGQTKEFESGYAMWKWASQVSKNKLETKFDPKKGPFLCDWFERRRKKKTNN
jgi:hypothetical protein